MIYVSENVLNETGEGNAEPHEVHIIKSTDIVKEYTFRTEDDDKYVIRFSRMSIDENEWNVVFGIVNELNHHDFTAVVNNGFLLILSQIRFFLNHLKEIHCMLKIEVDFYYICNILKRICPQIMNILKLKKRFILIKRKRNQYQQILMKQEN